LAYEAKDNFVVSGQMLSIRKTRAVVFNIHDIMMMDIDRKFDYRFIMREIRNKCLPSFARISVQLSLATQVLATWKAIYISHRQGSIE